MIQHVLREIQIVMVTQVGWTSEFEDVGDAPAADAVRWKI